MPNTVFCSIIDGLREMVNDFEENGVRVLLPYLPWDQGTRNTGQSDVISLIDVIIRSNCSGKLHFQFFFSLQKKIIYHRNEW